MRAAPAKTARSVKRQLKTAFQKGKESAESSVNKLTRFFTSRTILTSDEQASENTTSYQVSECPILSRHAALLMTGAYS